MSVGTEQKDARTSSYDGTSRRILLRVILVKEGLYRIQIQCRRQPHTLRDFTFNAAKCTHMTYGNAKIKSKYKMKEGDGKVTDIRHDDEVEKDLGVLFDRSCLSDNTLDAQ